jgi:mycofactocin system glycosyltransferase
LTSTRAVPDTTALPFGFAVELDPDARPLSCGGWFGARPGRVVRLTEAGASAWAELAAEPIRSRDAAVLARRLTDAGIAHPVPPESRHRPDVSVVIPVRDRVQELQRCLASLAGAYPVVVVDDASHDELGIRAVAAAYGARLVRLGSNVGPAQARNIGSREVDTELIAYIDSDTVPGNEWISVLANHFADPAVAAVAPRIVPIADRTSAGRYTRARCNLDLGPDPARVMPYGRVSYVPTAALLVRRCAALGVAGPGGVFDPAMRIGEDVDVVWRLHRAGWRVRYDPSQLVPHQEPASWRALLRRRRRYGMSTPSLARRHPEAMAPLVLYPTTAACAAAQATRRPAVAVASLAAAAVQLRAALSAAGVPDTDIGPRAVSRATVAAVVHTWIGIGRYLVQFAPWAIALGLSRRRTRLPTAALVLAPMVVEWRRRAAPIGAAAFAAGYLADEIAYGTGVMTGCVRERTLVPLRPTIVRRRV